MKEPLKINRIICCFALMIFPVTIEYIIDYNMIIQLELLVNIYLIIM